MVFGFSGYLLPMDELAYFATKVGPGDSRVDSAGVGPFLADLIRGGPELTRRRSSASSRCTS